MTQIIITGKPCKHGHTSGRYAADNRCVECTIARGAKFYANNKVQIYERVKERRAADPEKTAARNKAFYEKNKDKIVARQRASRLKDPDKHANWARKSKGLPEATRPRPEVCENEGCQNAHGKLRLCLDHDHKTGKFRGWLCMKCNAALGLLKDSEERIQGLSSYLKKNGEKDHRGHL